MLATFERKANGILHPLLCWSSGLDTVTAFDHIRLEAYRAR